MRDHQQLELPRDLRWKLTPRTPLPMWLQHGRPFRELRSRVVDVLGGAETLEEAASRGRMERVRQGFGEQVELPWP